MGLSAIRRPLTSTFVLAGLLFSAACATDRPSAAPQPSSSANASGEGSRAELVAAVDSYVRARNGSDLGAYRESMCESVRDAAASRRPANEVVVDRVDDVRVDGRTATVTVDLRYADSSADRQQTLGPFRGIQWTFLRESGGWKQCTPPAFH